MSAWAEQISLLSDPDERWVLLVGSHLGASSGVPLPFQRTPWSPSIADLVRYHIFRTQSREVSDSVQKALGEGKPPLGFLADDLEGQIDWLKTYTDKIMPQRAVIRLADLIKAEMFSGIVSNAPDDLLERALDLLGIEHETLSLEHPTSTPGSLPLLKEWDDLVFQDTADRRTREASYIKGQLEAMLQEADAVLFVGCHPYASDLMNNMLRICQSRPELKLVWLDEARHERGPKRGDGATAPEWLAEHHPRFSRIEADDFGDVLDAIAQSRGIQPSPLMATPTEVQSGLAGLLNRSFDVKPILIYVPGMALFSGVLDKMPKISLKALLSLATLVLAVLGFLNYREYQAYDKSLLPAQAALGQATALVKDASPRYQQLVQAEKALDEGRKNALAVTDPKPSLISLPLLQTYLKRRRKQLLRDIASTRSQKVIPMLVKRRLQRDLQSSPLLRNMGHFPDVSVSVRQREVDDDAAVNKDQQGASDKGKRRATRTPFTSTQQVRPLGAHKKKQHLALFASSSMLLQVVMNQQMLTDLQQGQLVIPIDLDKAEGRPLEFVMRRTLQRLAGYGTRPDPRYHSEGLEALLNKGKASLYFLQLDTSGGVSKNLERINTLLERFPKCRGIIATYLKDTFQRIGADASRFVRLEIQQYKQRQARAFLRANTSHRFFRGVMNNSYLRWSMTRPLVMSLLINYYRWVGQPPRSLGVIYDRLLRTMLQGARFGLAHQLQALGALAHHTLSRSTNELQRELATQLIATRTKLTISQASALLDDLVKRGVMRYPSLTHVRFMDTHFQYLGVARELKRLPFAKRRHFLLRQNQKLISFYAGVQPNLTRLVRAWLRDYQSAELLLRAKGRQLDWINPYLPALKYAALAVNNGDVEHRLVKQLEGVLFGLLKHRRYGVIKDTVSWGITHMSTAGLKQRILQGIERDASYDHRLFRLASMSPQDIYLGAIQRWMQRVRTPRDGQPGRRLSAPAPKGKQAIRRHRRMLRRTRTSFGRAISLLVGLGTYDAIQTALGYAKQEKDPRFSQRDWRVVRLYAMYMLIVRGYFREVAPTLETLLTRHPQRWPFLVSRLYKANAKRAAALLARIILQPGPMALATANQRRKARRWLKVKRSAALALARLDEDLSIPALKAAIGASPGAEDYRPYIAIALGRRGDKEYFVWVKKLLDQWQGKRWPASAPTWYRRQLSRTLLKAVALFGTKDAFKLLQQVKQTPWRQEHRLTFRAIDPIARYIKLPASERYYVQRLLCQRSKRKYGKYRLLLRLASIQTPTARARINQLLQIKLGSDNVRFCRRYCGKKHDANKLIETFRKASSLDDFVWALGRFQEPGDLPRFAEWALHPKRIVRRAALIALGRYSQAEASEALQQSLRRYPQDARRIIRMLGRQRRSANEPLLLSLLQQQRKQWQTSRRATPAQRRKLKRKLMATVKALRRTGTFTSLLQLYPMLGDAGLTRQAARTLYRLLQRNKGKGWHHGPLLSAIRTGKAPKSLPKVPTIQAPPSPRKRRRLLSRRSRKRTKKPRKRRSGGFGGGFGGFGKRKKGGFGGFR